MRAFITSAVFLAQAELRDSAKQRFQFEDEEDDDYEVPRITYHFSPSSL